MFYHIYIGCIKSWILFYNISYLLVSFLWYIVDYNYNSRKCIWYDSVLSLSNLLSSPFYYDVAFYLGYLICSPFYSRYISTGRERKTVLPFKPSRPSFLILIFNGSSTIDHHHHGHRGSKPYPYQHQLNTIIHSSVGNNRWSTRSNRRRVVNLRSQILQIWIRTLALALGYQLLLLLACSLQFSLLP